MNTAEFLKLRDLFDQAISMTPENRETFLARECAGNPSLLAQARGLLAVRLSQAVSAARLTSTIAGHGWPEGVSDARIGPYRLRAKLGEGGMGTVYLALRDDGTFRKSVALKILKKDHASPELIERFHQERQVLANLDHNNIARILDGGQTPDGLPFYVMEYVEGVPLDQFCDQWTLDLEGRVRIFLQVCDAVNYLHGHLVIHRDLKPTNILVSSDGVVKLLDFGIAKQHVPSSNAELTAMQGRIMTPGFASPEQFAGTPVTAASDIYTLGVILYLLLTGSMPHATPAHKLTTEPSPPSSRIRVDIQRTPETTMELRRRIVGDLDNVVLMCLRRDPRNRYRTAGDLSDDLQRFLHGRPVLARKGPLLERTIRFVKRNRVVVAVCLLVALLTSFGGWQAIEARIQSTEAHRQAKLVSEKDVQLVRLARLLDQFEKPGTIKTPPKTLLENVKNVGNAIPRDLGAGGLTPERSALLQRTLTYLDQVKPMAARNPLLAGQLAAAYKQAGILYQPSSPERALAAFSNARVVLLLAYGNDAYRSPYSADWEFVNSRIQALGGGIPDEANEQPNREQTSARLNETRAASLRVDGAQRRDAGSSEIVSKPEPVVIPAELQEHIGLAETASKIAEGTFNQVKTNSAKLGQEVNYRIQNDYLQMKTALESAKKDARAGDFGEAEHQLNRAEEFARRVGK